MKIYVGVTDSEWFDYLSGLPEIDEVNFWQPSGDSTFKALNPGEMFLFKLHSPRDYIVGGGIFAYATNLPISLVWDAFKEKNGASSYEDMRGRIIRYRRNADSLWEDFKVGCILLTQPFFLNKSDWFKVPEWSSPIVRGKRYYLNSEAGKLIWRKIVNVLYGKEELYLNNTKKGFIEEHDRYGNEMLIKPRLGQGAFKILVTDAYNRSCAITREKALPVLEAAHIRPYSQEGPHEVKNGILFRSDMHKLFDKGYMTVTPKLHIEVSRRIKEEFENGKYYYNFHGEQVHLPQRLEDNPSSEFLTWHNENKYKG